MGLQHLGKSSLVGHQGLDEQNTSRMLNVHTQTKMCEGFTPRSFCQKNNGTIWIK